jgi:hypothetical protein
VAESHREQERLESSRGDPLPWQRGERLERVREGREGGSPERRSEHENREQRGGLAALPETIQTRRASGRHRLADCHISLNNAAMRIGA